MKVLHTNCDYIWTPLHRLMVEQLTEQGVDSVVFSPVYTKKNAQLQPTENEIVKVCFRKNDRFVFHLKQEKIMRAFSDVFCTGRGQWDIRQFDILHSYYLFTDGNYTRKMALKYGLPYVTAVRNTDVNVFFKRLPFLRNVGIRVMLDASKVFFLSESYRKYVLDRYIPEKYRDRIMEKSLVIPNGIHAFWHENRFLSRDYDGTMERFERREVRLIYVGGIDDNKNIGLTLQAMKKLKSEGWNVHLDIVGPVVDQKVFDSTVKDAPDVTYTPQIPKEALIQKYREADIFVMPSKTETFGLVYAEAMSQGLPVIYTRGQGFDGQFPEGEVGFSVDSADSEELRRAIVKIVEQYQVLSEHCLAGVSRYSWEIITKKYIKTYSSVINGDC